MTNATSANSNDTIEAHIAFVPIGPAISVKMPFHERHPGSLVSSFRTCQMSQSIKQNQKTGSTGSANKTRLDMNELIFRCGFHDVQESDLEGKHLCQFEVRLYESL